MGRYVLRRAGQGMFVLWAAFTISFFVLYLLPSDPAALMASGGGEADQVDPALLDALRAQYGLDRPVLVQYADALWHALRLDFGTSYSSGAPATPLVLQALPETFRHVRGEDPAHVVKIALGEAAELLASAQPGPSRLDGARLRIEVRVARVGRGDVVRLDVRDADAEVEADVLRRLHDEAHPAAEDAVRLDVGDAGERDRIAVVAEAEALARIGG